MLTDPLVLALGVIVAATVALFAIEIWTVRTGRPTISERFQDLNRRMDKQLIAGIFFLLGALAGWFIAHFTS
jgi:hypothetical protein